MTKVEIMKNSGYKISPNDRRDFIFSALKPSTVSLPPKFLYPDIEVNEQVIGDCVGQAARAIKTIQERKNHPKKNLDFAPDFIYSECKKLDGIPNEEGTHPRVAMKVLQNIGATEKPFYPGLTEHNTRPTPNLETYENAKNYKVKTYAQVETVEDMKQALVEEGPILAGVIVTTNFYENKDGWIDLPGGYFLGGHALAITGYDDNLTHTYPDGTTRKGFFRMINSWGTDWGNKGYAWLPYDYVKFESDLGMKFFMEAWTSVDVIMPDKDYEPIKPMEEKITLWVNKKQVIVNGIEVTLDAAPQIVNGRTLVPVRFISEQLGHKVQWFAGDQRIEITK
ncbi:stalk domain-containing protein [Schinkia azotoformans]|uniref:stalk domain-containing protein n=1 Tax=Schinkia azotoformans TaxID=1454 RepID=UPI002DB99008|nr:stalk domain-containing protein [Schinkia azotoformans]MEC1744096.1 stalk domain-containing protein [Schinkia azotoformans]